LICVGISEEKRMIQIIARLGDNFDQPTFSPIDPQSTLIIFLSLVSANPCKISHLFALDRAVCFSQLLLEEVSYCSE
jgi:hypothetical protein